MKKIILVFFFCLNSWGLTIEELISLEKELGDSIIIPTSFQQACYNLVAKEDNPHHVKILSTLMDTAQKKDRDEVLKLLKDYETLLKIE